MITYNDLYEALRKERYSEQLQNLPKDYISQIGAYLNDKKKMAEKEDDLFSDAIIKTKKQLENAVSIFKELILRRKKKLLNLAFIATETGISKRDYENMLDFEKKMFDKIMSSMDESEKDLSGILSSNGGKSVKKNKMVLFKEEMTELMGSNGNKVGPFEKGEVANLPSEIVDILKESGKVELIDE
ncbi:MAG: hypothetical protein KKF56_03615 [Nanoarchaeota archaeon]|nr:hypothetical protein [Nanoarchaeota archaeon]